MPASEPTRPDLEAAIRAHAERFNAAVHSGDWAPFVSTFAPDAVLRFVGVPAGPYHGRRAISEAYRTRPPDDTMTISAITTPAPDTAIARFAWAAGGGGTLTVRWVAGQIAELVIVFG